MNPPLTLPSFLRRIRALLALLAVTAVLAPSPASAIEPSHVPSIGADTGRFNLPISCVIRLGDSGKVPVARIKGTVDIQGVAPVQLGPGQAFYLSQGSGALTLPKWLGTLAGLVAIDKADANVDSLLIGATNSTPATIDLAKLYDLSVNDIPVKARNAIVVGLPATGTFVVGPYIAPNDGRVQFQFQGATAKVTLKDKLGFSVKVHATCSAEKENALLSVAVGSQVDASQPALYENEPLSFPAVDSGNLVGIVNAPYTCAIGSQQYKVGIAVGAIIPLAVQRFGSIDFTEASGAITLPVETVNRFIDAGINSVQGKVSALNLIVENGYLRNPNVLPDGTDIPFTPLVRNTPVIVSLPVEGTVTAGPFRPKPSADSMVVGLGSAAATLQFNGSGEDVPVSCPKPEPDALLVDAPII